MKIPKMTFMICPVCLMVYSPKDLILKEGITGCHRKYPGDKCESTYRTESGCVGRIMSIEDFANADWRWEKMKAKWLQKKKDVKDFPVLVEFFGKLSRAR